MILSWVWRTPLPWCYDWGLGLFGLSTYQLWLWYKVCLLSLVMDIQVSVSSIITCMIHCYDPALTWSAKCTSGRHSREGGQNSLIGKQLHPTSSEYMCWQKRQTDGLRQTAKQMWKRHMISHVMIPQPMLCIWVNKISHGDSWHNDTGLGAWLLECQKGSTYLR